MRQQEKKLHHESAVLGCFQRALCARNFGQSQVKDKLLDVVFENIFDRIDSASLLFL